MKYFYKKRSFIIRKLFNIFKIENYWRKGFFGWEGHVGITSHNRIFSLFINFRPSTFIASFEFSISKSGLSLELGLYAHLQIHILLFNPNNNKHEIYDDDY